MTVLKFTITILFLVITMLQSVLSQTTENGFFNDKLSSQPFRVITIAVPDFVTAQNFSRALVTQGMAATVNIFPSTVSMYIWNGELKELPEIILFIYTHASQYNNIEKFIKTNHVHLEPGIVMLPIVGGSPGFFTWLEHQVVRPPPQPPAQTA